MENVQIILKKIRSFLENINADALFIPKHDCFFGEHIQERDEILRYITGFSGSFGFCIITKTTANLWVDGRYTVQAKLETDSKEWTIYRYGEDTLQSFFENQNVKTLAFDPWLVSVQQYKKWQSDFKNIQFILLDSNWIDSLWKDRPQKDPSHIFNHDILFSGIKTKDKIKTLSPYVQKPYLIFKPENLCWLLNIRGNDVPYTPLVQGAALWHENDTLDIFVKDEKNIINTIEELKECVTVYPFCQLKQKLQRQKNIFINEESTPYALIQNISFTSSKEVIDPIKARKNQVEQNGMKKAHIKDAVAIIKTLYWLDHIKSKDTLTELDVSSFLLEQRKQETHFLYPSFETISASGPNGAIIHYHPTPKNNRLLKDDSMLLLDSGGQYLEGTTDITRTIAIGNPSNEEKIRYTQVLKGCIALSSMKFPKGTTGGNLDILARQYLWKEGLNFQHGTGHGVGHCLNVHEGPQSISSKSMIPLDIGMIVSNEPGYYKENCFGIRLENLELVKESFYKSFLEFETITLAPYDKRLIVKNMLEKEELEWLQHYYKRIKLTIFPNLPEDHQNWLEAFMTL